MLRLSYHQIKDFTVMTIMITAMVYSTLSPGLKVIILFKGFQRSWILTNHDDMIGTRVMIIIVIVTRIMMILNE